MKPSIRPHPDASDADLSDLGYFLQRLKQAGQHRYDIPVDPGPNGHSALNDILNEIDETVLARQITVTCKPGTDITLTVSNRRLLAIKPCLAPPPDQQTPDAMAHRFADALHAAIAPAKTVTIRPPRPIYHDQASDLSVSAALLRQSLGLDQAQVAVHSPALDTASTLRQAALAWVQADRANTFPAQQGPEPLIAQLKSFWHSYGAETAHSPRPDRIQNRSDQLFFLPLPGKRGLAVYTDDHQSWVLAILPQERFQTFLDTPQTAAP